MEIERRELNEVNLERRMLQEFETRLAGMEMLSQADGKYDGKRLQENYDILVSVEKKATLLFLKIKESERQLFQFFLKERGEGKEEHENAFDEVHSIFPTLKSSYLPGFLYQDRGGLRYVEITVNGFGRWLDNEKEKIDQLLAQFHIDAVLYIGEDEEMKEVRMTYIPFGGRRVLEEVNLSTDEAYHKRVWEETIDLCRKHGLQKASDVLSIFTRVMAELGKDPSNYPSAIKTAFSIEKIIQEYLKGE